MGWNDALCYCGGIWDWLSFSTLPPWAEEVAESRLSTRGRREAQVSREEAAQEKEKSLLGS